MTERLAVAWARAGEPTRWTVWHLRATPCADTTLCGRRIPPLVHNIEREDSTAAECRRCLGRHPSEAH